MVNETRAQFTNSNLSAPPSDPIGPAVSISGVASFGTLSGSPTARVNQLYEGTDSLSIQQGAHAIRVGADFLYNDDTITFPRTIRGSYAFSSLANFLNGVYNSSGYTQTFGVTQVHQTNPNVGFYAQDEYKVDSQPDAEPRSPLRPGVSPDDRNADRERFPAGRVRLVAFRVAPHGGSRRLWAVLRPHSTSAARKCLTFGGQHDRCQQPSAIEHQPFAHAGGRSGVSRHPGQSDDSARACYSTFPP